MIRWAKKKMLLLLLPLLLLLFAFGLCSSPVSDIIGAGCDCSLVAIEIGWRGLIDTDNKTRLTHLSKDIQIRIKFSNLKTQLIKSVLISLYSRFNARHELSWNINGIILFFPSRHDFSHLVWFYSSALCVFAFPAIGMDCNGSEFWMCFCMINKGDIIKFVLHALYVICYKI